MQGDVGQSEDGSRGLGKNIPRKNPQDSVNEGKEICLNCIQFYLQETNGSWRQWKRAEGYLSKDRAHNRHSNVFSIISSRIGPEDPYGASDTEILWYMQILKIVGEQGLLRYWGKRKGRIVIILLAGLFWEGLILSHKAPSSEWKEVEEQEEQKSQTQNFNTCLQIFANFTSYSFSSNSYDLSRAGIISSVFI